MNRFWSKVDKKGANDCWPWTAGTFGGRYGAFQIDGRPVTAHRMAYSLSNGEVPDDKVVCHSCDNPLCCNPAHLFLGTHADNMEDKTEKSRQYRPPTGEKNQNAVLFDLDRINIKTQYQSGRFSQRQLAEMYGVSLGTINRTVKG